MIVNTIAALVDITPEMGGTLVVPGSHRWEPGRDPESHEEVAACSLPAGSALFFRGDTLHAGGANRTRDRWRRALSTGYCCGWLRPVENSYTNIPPEVARTLPRRAQELLGYALYDASDGGWRLPRLPRHGRPHAPVRRLRGRANRRHYSAHTGEAVARAARERSEQERE